MHTVTQIVLVAVGSALGGLLRWGVGAGFAHLFESAFPWGTFVINITGSFFLGWFSTMLTYRAEVQAWTWLRPEDLQLLVAVGFTGAYTTFSTFEFETHRLWERGQGWLGLAYVIASVALGLIAVHLGVLIARSNTQAV